MLLPNDCEFFDPYGEAFEFYKHLMPPAVNVVKENCIELQSDSIFVCGEYCFMFVYERSQGISYEDFLDNFKLNSSYND